MSPHQATERDRYRIRKMKHRLPLTHPRFTEEDHLPMGTTQRLIWMTEQKDGCFRMLQTEAAEEILIGIPGTRGETLIGIPDTEGGILRKNGILIRIRAAEEERLQMGEAAEKIRRRRNVPQRLR